MIMLKIRKVYLQLFYGEYIMEMCNFELTMVINSL